ncbi:copia protein [Tanacetum coccineum]
MSRSSSEAKYRLMATTRCELKWLKGLLNSLGVTHPKPMRLFFDNQVALHIVANPVFHERTKHIEVDCHFVHDEILSGNLAPSYVHTSTQLVDIFTKALGNQQFHDILSKRSTSGYCVFCQQPIVFVIQEEYALFLSSVEVEYRFPLALFDEFRSSMSIQRPSTPTVESY